MNDQAVFLSDGKASSAQRAVDVPFIWERILSLQVYIAYKVLVIRYIINVHYIGTYKATVACTLLYSLHMLKAQSGSRHSFMVVICITTALERVDSW